MNSKESEQEKGLTTRTLGFNPSRPRKIGLAFGAAHLLIVLTFAAGIYVANAHDGESPMYWIFLVLADIPVSLLFGPLTGLVHGRPPVSWLPGLMGDWDNYLLPFLFFATLGSVWWFCMGWGLGHLWNTIRRRRARPQ